MRSYLGAGFKRRFLGLCVPPLVLGSVDGSLTLVGQSSFYWENYLAVNEANPIFASLLQVHPVAFLAGAAAWLAMLCTMILVLPRLADVLNVPANVRAKIGSAVFALGALLWLFPWRH